LIHILRHTTRVAADTKIGTLLQPVPDFLALLAHAVLDIDFARLIAGKGEAQFGQQAVFMPLENIIAVIKIGRGVLLAEKQPIFALMPARLTLLQKAAKWRDARARPHHNQRGIAVFRHMKMFAWLNKDRRREFAVAVGEKG